MEPNNSNQPQNSKLAALEALLFIHGEPLTLKKIGAVLGLEKEDLEKAVLTLGESLSADSRGLALTSDGTMNELFQSGDWGSKKIQLTTKPDYTNILEMFIKEELHEDLSPASVEALSLIAYLGPISRSRLDYVRGVNSSFILRSLLLRGLIERVPDSEHSGAFLYRPSFDFLRTLGVTSKEELPEYSKFKSLENFDMVNMQSGQTPPPETAENQEAPEKPE